ncbi:MAG: hypothetical protein CV081_01575 [Nitrospira sp. LK265]|nr:hypothetical protein [Nitrospira sp. LK265]
MEVSNLPALDCVNCSHNNITELFISGYGDEAIQHHRINQRFVPQQPYRQSGLIEKERELLDAV